MFFDGSSFGTDKKFNQEKEENIAKKREEASEQSCSRLVGIEEATRTQRENIKEVELRRIRTRATQQLARGLGSCGGGKRKQPESLNSPKREPKKQGSSEQLGSEAAKMARGSNPECCNSQKTQINAVRQQEGIGLGSGKMLGGGEREDQQESNMKRIHEGKRASVVAMEAESITRDERNRSRSMSS